METQEIVKLLQQQLAAQEATSQQQLAASEEQLKLKKEEMEKQCELQEAAAKLQEAAAKEQIRILKEQNDTVMQTLSSILQQQGKENSTSRPAFQAFDSTSELWVDYWDRFSTFLEANTIPVEKAAPVFLNSQSPTIYKLLSNLASQRTPPVPLGQLSLTDLEKYMSEQFHPTHFIVRERFKFWSDMSRKPDESVQELASRIRQDAVTCDFTSIKDPLDEAMRTRFICSLNNEAVLKAFFKFKDKDLTFAKAIQTAQEHEDTAKVAKETALGTTTEVHVVKNYKNRKQQSKGQKKVNKGTKDESQRSTIHPSCLSCGKTNHARDDCFFRNATCMSCNLQGHISKVCRKKKDKGVNSISAKPLRTVNTVRSNAPLRQPVILQSETVMFDVDTGACDSFISRKNWERIGKPTLRKSTVQYQSASKHPLTVIGTFRTATSVPQPSGPKQTEPEIQFVVTEELNLLGRDALSSLPISLDALMGKQSKVHTVTQVKADIPLQKSCEQVAKEFTELFKPELGCLKDMELEVRFKPDAQPKFCKPRPVPFAVQDDLAKAYDEGIKKGVWKATQFNEWGTPVVPVRKSPLPGQTQRRIRVCGDYSVAVNGQLEPHRQPLPLPSDLRRKLSGGCGFTKIDLADAYNQIPLSEESQKRLALSTHRGVLLQTRLPFGISSAPGYFQEIMTQLTSDLPGVAVFLDDILVSGTTAEDHLSNLRGLLQRLQDKGLRCRKEKCQFAQPSVEYLGHTLSSQGIGKGSKADAVQQMPEPENVAGLRSFMGSINFYCEFLPATLSTITEPLHRLTRSDTPWKWGQEERAAFLKIKEMLSEDTVLAHFDPSLPLGLSCDASEVGVGAVLFHRYPDGGERPIANASKTMTPTQRRYSQIQREALSVIFGLNKFHQFLYGRKFILVTDHRPLLTLFGPKSPTPALAANRLARWSLILNQYSYDIEYRSSSKHGNADALSRLPAGSDPDFDEEEDGADIDTVCTIEAISKQFEPSDATSLSKASKEDRTIAQVMKHIQEGWPSHTREGDSEVEVYHGLEDSLSTSEGCLLYGERVVIPSKLRRKALETLHLGHIGMEKMKQLARSAVYWPGIDADINNLCRTCTSCAEHQNLPAKSAVHPWIPADKPWSRLHVDHAINFLGSNWLVVVDAFSKYPCIYPTSSTSTKATTDLLEEACAHFGYPQTIVSDNATTFTSEAFKQWCAERGISHVSGAPYHPQTNGAAERLVQTFKQSLRKSQQSPRAALLEFLQQHRRTPQTSGFSPSELLHNRQIRTRIDILKPQPATKTASIAVPEPRQRFRTGSAVYALYCGPRREKDPRWVPAIVTKVRGSRTYSVKVCPRGPCWKRHVDQLRPRYTSVEDDEPTDLQACNPEAEESVTSEHAAPSKPSKEASDSSPDDSGTSMPSDTTSQASPPYTRDNPRRSHRTRKTVVRYGHEQL